jgi:serine/threonine protein phosphatase PrpC
VPAPAPEAPPEALAVPADDDAEEILPDFDNFFPPQQHATPRTEVLPARPTWPSVAWERTLLNTLDHPGLPRIVASFTEGDRDYLVEEVPVGRSFWDAWDDPEVSSYRRYGWLIQIAEALQSLHQCQCILEGLRPDQIVIADDGQARLTDLSDLLPVPLPENAPIKATLYTAPELAAGHGNVDPRADLYSFGAMLYSLYVGRELNEKTDFDRPGVPTWPARFPDIHPGLGRLLLKTFRKDPDSRFPTDEASKEDLTGFAELIRTLQVLRRSIDNVRLEVASWTTTGIVRTGNEDAYAVLHACESRQDDVGESALVLLCDGMGGYEAGEVAAALAIQAMRQYLVQQKMFAHLAGASAFPHDALSSPGPEGHAAPPLDVEQCKGLLKAALKEANKQVFSASRSPGSKRRGMGCTAEAVYVDGGNVVVGHVGDSRTYHLHEGRLIQLTRDQTLVNRLVELGTLTAEEAEKHPRRNELQQAIGGQPDVEPGLYAGVMKPGDWVLVCSDGLTNHVTPAMLKEMLLSEAQSAEMAARRLVNLANIEGATDNATVVVIRAT